MCNKFIFLFGLIAVSLSAQSSPDPIRLGDIDFSATLRSRVYDWNWFQPAGTYQNQYAYSGNLLGLNFAENAGSFDFDEELAVVFMLGLPAKATAPAPAGGLGLGSNYYSANGNKRNAAMAFPKQLWARYHFGDNLAQTLQAGRLEFNDGTELASKNPTIAKLKNDRVSARLIGTFAFTDVQRSFDGLHYSWDQPTSNFTILTATPTRGVFQTDGWGWNQVGFGYAAYTKDWGHGAHAADTRFFFIDYDDFRSDVLKTDNRPLAVRKADTGNINVQSWGADSIHTFATKSGTFDALGWGVGQTGKWGAQTQRAWAYDVETGYQPAILPALKPWIRAGYTVGSGDSNPNGSTHSTFFQVLPTPRQYARTPFFNMMNTEDAFGSLMLRPHSRVTISSEAHSLRLTNRNDFWYTGGGVFQPWSFGYTGRSASGARSLADLYDTSVEYRANRHATLTAYLGYMQGLAVIKTIYPAGRDGTFGYLEVLLHM